MIYPDCKCFARPKANDEEHIWIVGIRKGENDVALDLEPSKTLFLSMEQAIKYAHEHNMRVQKMVIKRVDVKEVHYKHLGGDHYKVNNCCIHGTTNDDQTYHWKGK